MAANSSGSQNQPLFTEGAASEMGTDLSLVSDYAALVGNRKIGTTGDRLSIFGAERWKGLAFYDTDISFKYVWDGYSWIEEPVHIRDAQSYLTMSSNWTHINSQLVVHGAYASFRCHVKRTATLSSVTDGNIANTEVLTLNDTTLRPLNTIAFNSENTGMNCSWALLSTGIMYITGLPPGIGLVNGDRLSFSGTYIRDVLG